LTIRTAGKAIILSAIYGTVLVFAWAVYSSYGDSNVSRITVSKLSDLDEAFEVGTSSLRVRNPEFLKVCFAGDYVYALKDARQWFAAKDTEFMPALRAAGGPADTFNDDEHSSIVLLSHTSALILQLDRRTGFSVVNLGCASADAGDIKIKRYKTNSSTEFYLPNATLSSPPGPEQPRAALCAEKLHRFVESIDELLAKTVAQNEPFWAVIRKYLPATGCRVDEVISISKTSRFFEPRIKDTDSTISFRNSDIRVGFQIEEDTGNIGYPDVSSTHLPSW
jgi:hypothetical protein